MLHSEGRLLALPKRVRLCWKGLSGTKNQAYFELSYITVVKGFATLGSGERVKEREKMREKRVG
jgi:hypothetical protein